VTPDEHAAFERGARPSGRDQGELRSVMRKIAYTVFVVLAATLLGTWFSHLGAPRWVAAGAVPILVVVWLTWRRP
jgi:hypothetical protein